MLSYTRTGKKAGIEQQCSQNNLYLNSTMVRKQNVQFEHNLVII